MACVTMKVFISTQNEEYAAQLAESLEEAGHTILNGEKAPWLRALRLADVFIGVYAEDFAPDKEKKDSPIIREYWWARRLGVKTLIYTLPENSE